MSKDDNLEELSVLYRQLIEFKPFQRLVADMEEKVEEMKEGNINNQDNDLWTKGTVSGIREVLNQPNAIIQQFDNSRAREIT